MRFAVATILACVFGAACTGGEVGTDGMATVTHVVDGDTIDVEIGGREERVRLIGIDSPELRPEVECFRVEARDYLRGMLP